MLGSTRQYVQTYAYVCIASHRRICEATSPYGLTIVTTTFLFALMLFITSAGLAGVVHGSCAAQFLVAHFQHIQAGEGTVGFVYTGDGEDEIGVICKFSCAFFLEKLNMPQDTPVTKAS